MANEAVIIELLGNKGDPVSYSCQDTDAIEKGALLFLDDSSGKIRYVSGSVAATVSNDKMPIGIAAAEKVASDGQTRIAVYTNVIADLKLNTDTCTMGDLMTISGANMVGPVYVTGNIKTANVLGKALETGTTTATVAVRVGPL